MAILPRILMIEDHPDVQQLVRLILGSEAELVFSASLKDGLKQLNENSFDLLLLDADLPDGDGFEFFSELKQTPTFSKMAVIFLTGRGEINDRVAAFALGAEDYIVKPIEPREFRARIHAKLKNRTLLGSDSGLTIGPLWIDRGRFRVFRIEADGGKTELGLTPYEFKLLSFFVEHEDIVFTRDQLITAAWGDSVHVLERTVDRHISSLRKKIGPAVGLIEPVHGVGYRFIRASKNGKKVAA